MFQDNTCLWRGGPQVSAVGRTRSAPTDASFQLAGAGSGLRPGVRTEGAAEAQAETEAPGLERVTHGGGRGGWSWDGARRAAPVPSASPTATASETCRVPRAQTPSPGGERGLTPALRQLHLAAGVAAEGLGSGPGRPRDQCPPSCVVPMRQEARVGAGARMEEDVSVLARNHTSSHLQGTRRLL